MPSAEKRVGIEQDSRLGRRASRIVYRTLWFCKPVLYVKKYRPPSCERRRRTSRNPRARSAAAGSALRSGIDFEEAERDLVLGLDPGAGRRRVGVLERPVRVGDLGPVVVVDRVRPGGLGILERSTRVVAVGWSMVHQQDRSDDAPDETAFEPASARGVVTRDADGGGSRHSICCIIYVVRQVVLAEGSTNPQLVLWP